MRVRLETLPHSENPSTVATLELRAVPSGCDALEVLAARWQEFRLDTGNRDRELAELIPGILARESAEAATDPEDPRQAHAAEPNSIDGDFGKEHDLPPVHRPLNHSGTDPQRQGGRFSTQGQGRQGGTV